MASAKELLTVPLTRKYGSMPSLAQKSMISLEYKDKSFIHRRISGCSEPQKTVNKQSKAKETQGVPLSPRPSETPAKTVRALSLRRENGWRSPLLERRQIIGVDRVNAGAMKKPNIEKTSLSVSKRRLSENVKFPDGRQSEWLSRISAFNERHNGAKMVNTSAKTGLQIKEQTNNFHRGQDTKCVKSRKTSLARTKDIPSKTVSTNKNTEKYPQAFSLEREFYFQDYRQKCVQWLKSLPDSETQLTSLR